MMQVKHELKFSILPEVNFTKCIYTSHICGNCALCANLTHACQSTPSMYLSM